MPSTFPAKAEAPTVSLSPKKDAARSPAPPRAGPSTANAESDVPPNATAKGSRRAQGWHSAVGGNGGAGTTSSSGIRDTASNLTSSRANSGMPRRSSVQFSEEVLDGHAAGRGPPKPRPPTNAAKDDAAFRQSMADFLTVMYGDRGPSSSSSSSGATSKDKRSGGDGAATAATGGGSGARDTGRGSEDKKALDAPRANRSASPHLPPSAAKGPLVKGLTAGSSRPTGGDRIDTLVDTLVRAYSRQAISSRGDFQGSGGPDDDNPISYNRPRNHAYRRAVASPRIGRGGAGSGRGGVDANEISLFVSQAMDSFIGPGGLRQQGLASTRSVLSSLGLDKNTFGLTSFQTRSNMHEVNAQEDESDSQLEPMYVGEQALFKSVGTRPNMNDVSISKSMRGVVPPMADLSDDGEGRGFERDGSLPQQRRISSGSAKNRLRSSDNYSLDSGAASGRRGSHSQQGGLSGSRAWPRRSSAADKRVTQSMSLDSKALGNAFGNGGGDDEDDSWGDDDAAATAAVSVPAAPAAAPTTSAAVVSSARSLLEYTKSRHSAAAVAALQELQDEEQLKRDVVMAVEKQLRGYIASLEPEESAKRSSRVSGPASNRSASGATTTTTGAAAAVTSSSRRLSGSGKPSGVGSGNATSAPTASAKPAKSK